MWPHRRSSWGSEQVGGAYSVRYTIFHKCGRAVSPSPRPLGACVVDGRATGGGCDSIRRMPKLPSPYSPAGAVPARERERCV